MDYYDILQNQINQNNSWSAEQAQKQMEFQERMSNTAHQREVADLKAAGLNPVLSARLNGASTPSGASATADPSATSALVNLMSKMLDVAETSASAVYNASSGNRTSGSGYTSASNLNNDDELTAGETASSLFDMIANGAKGIKNAVTGFINGLTGNDKAKYDNAATYVAGKKVNKTYNEVNEASKNVKIINAKTGEVVKNKDGTVKRPGVLSKVLTTLQRATSGSLRVLKK